ncbi:MAG: hypothetical protein IPJ79_08225 [Bacteroidetes bacterium]|nr:hypothetical protein [Bacteroidota bacterium]
MFGKKVGEESLFLSKGMNVQERKTKGLTTGHYIVKAETSKGCFVKRLFVDK